MGVHVQQLRFGAAAASLQCRRGRRGRECGGGLRALVRHVFDAVSEHECEPEHEPEHEPEREREHEPEREHER